MGHLEKEVTLDNPAISDPLLLSLKMGREYWLPRKTVLAAWLR